MSNMQKRLNYIDATKGVAILCITFLHFEQGVIPAWLNTWIGMFMITAFYVTSGWVTGTNNKPITAKELFKKRIKQLGVPYFWFSMLIIAFELLWVLFGFMGIGILLRDIYKTLVFRGIGTLWFLPVLIVSEYVFTIVKNCRNKWLWVGLAFITTVGANYIYNTYWQPLREYSELYKIIDTPIRPIIKGLYAWPIIAIGYAVARKWGNRITENNKATLLIISSVLFAISILLIIKSPFNIYYLNGVLSNTLPVIAFLCLFAVFTRNIITRFFTYWGKNSLILMCTHYSITMEILMAFDKYILHHTTFEGPRTIVYFIIAVLLTYPLVRLFNSKLKFMIGK